MDDGSAPTRVSVVSAYRFHMFELARQLDRRAMLARLVTAMPVKSIPEVRDARIESRSRRALVRHMADRLTSRSWNGLNRNVIQDFDRWALTKIREEQVLSCLSGFATDTMERAKARGIAAVCDRGSWHILEQKRVLDEVADLWNWPRERFDPWIIERELRDYDVADRIFVPSRQARDSFVRHGTSPERLATVPYGADLACFTPAPFRVNPFRLISVGPIGIRKGHPALIAAYGRVRRPGSSLVLVGARSRIAAHRLDLSAPDVVSLGRLSRAGVAREMRTSGIFVLASVEEGLALVILQAMACGLPIVATEATGVADVLDDGVEGFVVPSGDIDALATALDRLLGDQDLAAAMGRAGRAKVLGMGGWSAYGDAASGHFRSLVSA